MSNSDRLELPFVEAAQAQKHVTVNEAFQRLDGIVQLTLSSTSTGVPPALVQGAFAVPAGAVNAWDGQDGRIALAANGGWEFVTPGAGWRAWVTDLGAPAVFDGTAWVAGAASLTPNGAGMTLRTYESEHVVAAGATSVTAPILPAQSVVIGITGRVIETIPGAASGFALGVLPGSSDRYGTGYGLSAGSTLRGITSAPLTYYSDTALTLTADGGAFSGGGRLRLAVHCLELGLPAT